MRKYLLNLLLSSCLLGLVLVTTACDGSAPETTVEEYAVDTETMEEIPKEIYESETAVIQDNIADVISNYDKRLELMDKDILGMQGEEQKRMMQLRNRVKMSVDTLKAATQYPNNRMPTATEDRQRLERILEQLAAEIRDL